MKKEKLMKKRSGNMMRTMAMISMMVLVLALMMVTGSLTGTSYYYYQDFATLAGATSTGWTNLGYATNNDLYNLGRDGIYFPNETNGIAAGKPNTPSVITISTGRLMIYGTANNGQLAYNNLWAGKVAQFIPANSPSFGSNLQASSQDPIGFMIIRYFANIDTEDDQRADSAYHQSAVNIWLAQDDPSVVNEWENLANFVFFMEQVKLDGSLISKLGYYDGSEHFPGSATSPLNENYTSFTSGDWRKVYDDNTTATLNVFSYGSPVSPNVNRLAIRITHDGSTVRYYLNPNPYGDLPAQPNTFYLIGESSVSWNTGLKMMFGHEVLHFHSEDQSAVYDDFLIRSVANTLKASIMPRKILAGGNTTFEVTAVPTFSANDSGIGEFIIRKPSYITNDWQLSTVVVSNDYNNDGTLSAMTRITTGLPANSSQFRVLTNHTGDLKIIFRVHSTDPGVINNSTSNKTNIIRFQLGTPTIANGTGADFQVFAHLEKYPNQTYNLLNLPTTGKKEAAATSTGALLVQTFYQPTAYAAVTSSPSPINEGSISEAQAQITYEISTKDVVSRPSISQAIINIPSGFNVSNVQSLLINNDAANIQVTSSNIILNYANDSVGLLPSPNGYDRITFSTYGTPNIADGVTNTNFVFSSTVSSSGIIDGTSHQATTTNALYPSQQVKVAAEDPKVQCHIFPNILANAIRTNSVTYTAYNNGNAYNKVFKLRILMNATLVDSVSGISSTVGGTVSYSAPYITVDYAAAGTNLAPGQTDSINFTMVHTITNLNEPAQTISFTADADNNNGKLYVPAIQDSYSWNVTFQPPDPKGVYYITPTEFWTSDTTNSFKVYILNNGPRGDKLFQAKIAIPAIFTNFSTATVSSSILSLAQNIVKTNISGTNYIWLKYYKENTNIASLNDNIGVYPKDVVTILLADNVTLTTNRYLFPVYVDNKSNDSFIDNFSSTNTATVFSTNSIVAELTYPPVIAAFDVQSRFTNSYVIPASNQFHKIDSSTLSNRIIFRVKNNGDYGNFIRKLKLYLPNEVSTNVVTASISSSVIASGGIQFIPKTATNDAYIYVNYGAALPSTNLSAGIQDSISFVMIDHVVDDRSAKFTVVAQNDREIAQITNIISGFGNSDSIAFFIPPARGAGAISPRVFFTEPYNKAETKETNTFVFTITNIGGGSNNITKAKIVLPVPFAGNVVAVSNSFLKATDASAEITTNATQVIITYTNTLAPGQVDQVYITVRVDYSDNSLTTSNPAQWQLLVDNAGTFDNSGFEMSGRSLKQYPTIRPFFNVYETSMDDHDVFTSNTTNTIKVRLVNGTNLICQSNARFRIRIPSTFNLPAISVANQRSATINQTSTNVVITYATPLVGYAFDIVTFVLSDDVTEHETNTVWQVDVDYGDGIWHKAASSRKVDTTWYTNVLSIKLPPATASTYLDPALLYVDVSSQTYSITLSNNGISGNHIRLVEIQPPSFITNITDVSHTGPDAAVWFSNGRLYLHYSNMAAANNGKLAVGNVDVISFKGWDNAVTSLGVPASWIVKVANTTNTNNLNSATIAFGKTLSTLVTFPDSRTEYHVSPSSVDTSVSSNQFVMYIDNKSPQTGSQDSYIEKVVVRIPSLFVTNNILSQVTSQLGASIQLSNYTTTNYLIFSYASPIAPKSNDMITFKLNDSFSQGNTNVFWNVNVNYNTTGASYIAANLLSGKTNLLRFVMPQPSLKAWLSVRELYTTASAAQLAYVVSNTGSGSNKVERVELVVPDYFTNSVHSMVSGLASSISYNNGIIIATYTNFNVGVADTITFNITNTISSNLSITFTGYASNSVYKSNTYVDGLENVLSVYVPPTSRIEPVQIDTTLQTTNIQVFINNSGSGTSALQRVKVVVPAIFTVTATPQSSKITAASISNSGNTYWFTYGSSQIVQGDSDILTFTVQDSFVHGETNANWQCYVDNGTGFSVSRVGVGTMTNSFIMPLPNASAWLDSTWIYASDSSSVYVTNTISFAVKNSGLGSNNIYRVVVALPDPLTNISSIVSHSNSAICVLENNTNLVIYYTNSLLQAGKSDMVSFTLVDNIDNELSYNFGFYAANKNPVNNDLSNFTKLSIPATPAGKQQRLDIFIKEEDPQVYLYSAKASYIWETTTNATMYTMDATNVLTFNVLNKSKRFTIGNVAINLTNLFVVNEVRSSTHGVLSSINHATNVLIIGYGANYVDRESSDVLYVTVSYNPAVVPGGKADVAAYVTANGVITNDVTCRVKYVGTADYNVTRNDGKNKLMIANANFGRILGKILPVASGATVTLKYTSTDSLATNMDGATFNAAVNTNTGVYVLDKVPEGAANYTMVVLPPTAESYTNSGILINPVSYQNASVPSLSVTRNVVSSLTNVILQYDKLNSQALGQQQVVCPEDTATMVNVPPNSLFQGVSINISIQDMEDVDEEGNAKNSALITAPADSSVLKIYQFKITDSANNITLENGFKGDVQLVLHYPSLGVTTQSWDESKLAIYYWKRTTKEWVMIGGIVDTGQQTVTANVSYMHTRYAVMQKKQVSTKTIHTVKASPNPFTPGRGGSEFSNVKLTFAFNAVYDKFEVKIYDMRGRLVRDFSRQGSYSQGEVFWDGKNNNGFYVRGGVYLYQIHAGGKVFTGSILVLK